MNSKTLLLEEIARSLDYWTLEGARAVTERDTSLEWTEAPHAFRRVQEALIAAGITSDARHVISEIVRGFAVSVLTILDGGTPLAEEQRFGLIDEHGEATSELHDAFVAHLFNTKRLE